MVLLRHPVQVWRIWRSFPDVARHAHERHQHNPNEAATRNTCYHPPKRNHLVAPFHWSRNTPRRRWSHPGPNCRTRRFWRPVRPFQTLHDLRIVSKGISSSGVRIGWTKRLKKARCEPGHELPPQPPNLTLFYKLIPLSLSLRPCRPVSYKYRPLSRGFKKLSQRSQQFRRVVAAGQQASSRDLDTARKVPAQGAACAGRGSARCGSQCLQRHFILISLRKDYISEHAFAHGSHCAL